MNNWLYKVEFDNQCRAIKTGLELDELVRDLLSRGLIPKIGFFSSDEVEENLIPGSLFYSEVGKITSRGFVPTGRLS